MRIAWIFGSSRSGSTWLLRMLSELRGVVPVDDPHLGHHLGVWRPIPLAWEVGEGGPPRLDTLLDLKAEEPGYFFAERFRDAWWQPLRDLIEARFRAQARDLNGRLPGSPQYVVKEPGSQAAPLLTELFPESKLVFLLRDGRDVVDSWLDAYAEGSWAIRGGAFAVDRGRREGLIRWLAAVWAYRSRAVRRAFESRPPGDRALVRYEDLLADTPGCLERICTVLGLEPEGIDEVVSRHRIERRPPAARGPGSAVRLARPGAWRDNMTAAEREALHEALAGALAEFGYGDEPAAASAAGATTTYPFPANSAGPFSTATGSIQATSQRWPSRSWKLRWYMKP